MFGIKVKKKVNLIGIKTDFSEISTLFLVYPENIVDAVEDYSHLSGFYDNLIKIIPGDISLKIIVKNKSIGEKVKNLRKNLDYIINSDIRTIWLRDTMGFNVSNKILKPIFKPKYYWGHFEVADQINQNSKFIHTYLNWDMEEIDLKWDCGNLVTNGTVGFLTNRIITDNSKQYNEQKVLEIIKEKLGIEPVLIPEFKGDEISHSDGYLAFLDEKTIVLPEYKNKEDKFGKKYISVIEKIVSNYNFKIIRLNEFLSTEMVDGMYTANGNYINYLKLNQYIILPTFGEPDFDNYNFKVLSEFGKVITIDCNEIAKYGGLLHCISWTM